MFFIISFLIYLAPRVDRHLGATDRYVHLSQARTIDERYPPRTIPSEIPPRPTEGEIFPPLPSGFEQVPSEPLIGIQQP